MTSRVRAVRRRAGSAGTGGSRLQGATPLAVTVAIAFVLQFGVPMPAHAQWGKLEKLSGPGGFDGPVFVFRVACFGRISPEAALAESLTREAIAFTVTANTIQPILTGTMTANEKEEEKKRAEAAKTATWQQAATKWNEVAAAWSRALGETYTPAPRVSTMDLQTWARTLERDEARPRESLHGARSMATSSTGVAWALCSPRKERRFAIDVAWSNLRADGSTSYTGSPIHVDMLMASVSLRVFASTKWDVLDVSAGAGSYWFTSAPQENTLPAPNPDGIPSLNGFVVQPILFTFHVPSDWSSRRVPEKGTRWRTILGRIASIPSVSWGFTLFPAGFEPGDFGAGDQAARRFPSEWLTTVYVSANVQPLLQLLGK